MQQLLLRISPSSLQWLRFTGDEMNNFIIFRCEISSGFCEIKITKISSAFLRY